MRLLHKSARREFMQRRGFTLIELLVSVALFSIVMSISISTLLAIVDANRKAQNVRTATESLNFAIDGMMRTLRTGHAYACGEDSYLEQWDTKDCLLGGNAVWVTDDQGYRIRYYRNDSSKALHRKVFDESGPASGSLTPPEVDITDLKFYVNGTNDGDQVQPSVTMVIRGEVVTSERLTTRFDLQTTMTQRKIDFDYGD